MLSVLTKEEMQHVLGHLSGTHLLMSELLFGSGLQLTLALSASAGVECVRLRVKAGSKPGGGDLDFAQRIILVRDSKVAKDQATLEDHADQSLIIRPKNITDGAIPSGNSIAATVLPKLSILCGPAAEGGQTEIYPRHAVEALRLLGGAMARYPRTFGQALRALNAYLTSTKEIVIIGDPQEAITQAVLMICILWRSEYNAPQLLQWFGFMRMIPGPVLPLLCSAQGTRALTVRFFYRFRVPRRNDGKQ